MQYSAKLSTEYSAGAKMGKNQHACQPAEQKKER